MRSVRQGYSNPIRTLRMVRVTGVEPAWPWSQTKCLTDRLHPDIKFLYYGQHRFMTSCQQWETSLSTVPQGSPIFLGPAPPSQGLLLPNMTWEQSCLYLDSCFFLHDNTATRKKQLFPAVVLSAVMSTLSQRLQTNRFQRPNSRHFTYG